MNDAEWMAVMDRVRELWPRNEVTPAMLRLWRSKLANRRLDTVLDALDEHRTRASWKSPQLDKVLALVGEIGATKQSQVSQAEMDDQRATLAAEYRQRDDDHARRVQAILDSDADEIERAMMLYQALHERSGEPRKGDDPRQWSMWRVGQIHSIITGLRDRSFYPKSWQGHAVLEGRPLAWVRDEQARRDRIIGAWRKQELEKQINRPVLAKSREEAA